MGNYIRARCILHCFTIMNSSAVKIASVLSVSDTFPFPRIYPEPHSPPPPLQPLNLWPLTGTNPGPLAGSDIKLPTGTWHPTGTWPSTGTFLSSWSFKPLGLGRTLPHHPHRLYARTLVDIICHGVRIGYEGPDQFIISHNWHQPMMTPLHFLQT